MIIKGSCRDFRIIEKSLRDPSMFSSNIIRGMQYFYGRRFFYFRIYFWTRESPELVKCGINARFYGYIYNLGNKNQLYNIGTLILKTIEEVVALFL
jgi:hypothetical protein